MLKVTVEQQRKINSMVKLFVYSALEVLFMYMHCINIYLLTYLSSITVTAQMSLFNLVIHFSKLYRFFCCFFHV